MQKRKLTKEKKIPVCHHCREDRAPDSDRTPRSNTWAYGMVGTRFLFCSVECRDKSDAEVRKSWKSPESPDQEGNEMT